MNPITRNKRSERDLRIKRELELNTVEIEVDLVVALSIEAPMGYISDQIDDELQNMNITCELLNDSGCEVMGHDISDFNYQMPDIIGEIITKMKRSHNEKDIDTLAGLTEQLQYILDQKNEL